MQERNNYGISFTSIRMFFNEDGDVISSADGECISVFDSFNVFDNTKVHDIIKVE